MLVWEMSHQGPLIDMLPARFLSVITKTVYRSDILVKSARVDVLFFSEGA